MNGLGSARRIQTRGVIRLIIISLLLLMAFPSSLIAEARHALVIGNGDYEEMGALKNPVNDATDMAGALANLGFEVQTLIDADVVTMEEAIVRFGQRLSYSVDSVGFFFYAGHGVQSSGINYLIPARAKIASEAFLRSRSVSAQAVLDTMQAAGNRLNIMVLDACRDNPFGWARSGQRGLSIVASQPPGSIIAYATSAGSVAGDGDGRNGIFTGELLKVLAIPEVDVSELFRLTGQAVQERTAGRQIPAIYSQFFDRKTLLPGSRASIAATVSVPAVQPAVRVGQIPAAKQASKAELFIGSYPRGADVTIDGKAKGKTPVFLDDVITGTTLVIEARLGTMSTKETYRVAEGFNELQLTLEQERGNLFIQTSESAAVLFLDGKRFGLVGNGLIKDVDAGRRKVEVRIARMSAVHEVVIVKDGTTTVVPEFKELLYTVGKLGPSGGYVFYDKGSYSDGWRYLEAAPAGWSGATADPVYKFGYYRPVSSKKQVGTSAAIGSGKENTQALVSAMGSQAYASPSGSSQAMYAARAAFDYSKTVDGVMHKDWFLPSKDELDLMYQNLHKKNLGGFSDGNYWSSTENQYSQARYHNFKKGKSSSTARFYDFMVRPIRVF